MKKSRVSEEQIIGILKEHRAGLPAVDACRKHGISDLLGHFGYRCLIGLTQNLDHLLFGKSGFLQITGSSLDSCRHQSTWYYFSTVEAVPVRRSVCILRRETETNVVTPFTSRR